MKKTSLSKVALTLHGMALAFTVPFSSALPNEQSADFFDLSLFELSDIKVTGAAIRSLNLSLIPDTNNPHELSVHEYAASIDVVDSKTIEARGLKNVVEVVESMVGILSGESPSEPYSFSTRGFSRNSVTVLYDGISLGLSTLNMRPLNTFNLERVEVVKGANVISAPTSSGGTVNIISKKPNLNEPARVDVLTRYGEFNAASLDLSMNAKINEISAYRFDFNRNQSDGWVDDSESQSTNMVASLLVTPIKKMDVTFSANYLNDELPAYWGTPLVPMSVAQNANTSVVSTVDNLVVDESTRYNNYNVADNEISSNALWIRMDARWQYSDQTVITAKSYNYRADRLWKNAESYQYDDTDGLVHRDRLLIDHERFVRGIKFGLNHVFNYDEIDHSFALEFESSINDFTRVTGFDVAALDFYDIDTVNLNDPVSGVFGNVDERKDKQTHIIDALSFQNRLSPNDQLSFELDVKFEYILFDRLYIQFDDLIRERKTLDTSFTQTSGRIATSYKLNEQHKFFVQYSIAHDPIENDIIYIYDLASYQISDVESFEFGFKSLFNNQKTELSSSFYRIDKESYFQTETDSGINHHHSQGLDLAVKHELAPMVKVGGNLAYVDAKYKGFYYSEDGVDASNKVPVNVPEVMLSSWLSWDRVFNSPIEVGAGFNYVSKRFANSTNTTQLTAYHLWNLFAAYQKDEYRLSMNIRNLTDEVYAPWSDIYYPNQVALGSPRTIDVTFRTRF